LYRTAIYSDEETITAVVMDRNYSVVDRYSRTMAMAAPRLSDQVWEALSPFSLTLRDPTSRYLSLQPVWHGGMALVGSTLALALAVVYLRARGHRPLAHPADLALVAVSGLYGLLALILLPPDTAAEPDAEPTT
jgi:hypothetical protein